MNEELYIMLAALNESINHALWPYYQAPWGICPRCGCVDFRHSDGCTMRTEIIETNADLMEELDR